MIALSAACQGALAADAKFPELSLQDPYSLKWAGLDHPAGLRVWARQQFSTLDPEQEAALWVQAVAAYVGVKDSADNNAEIRQILSKALELSAQYDIPKDTLFILQATQMEFEMVEALGVGAVVPPDQRDHHFQEKIRLAEQLKLPARKALSSLEWGQFMLESGREGEGIKKMHEAMRELNKASHVADLELMQAKEFYAAGLVDIQSKEKSKLIYHELEQFCEARKVRSFCLLVDQVYAYLVMNDEDKSSYEVSLTALMRALVGAEELEDQSIIAVVSNSLTRLLERMDRHEEALKFGLRAAAIFQKQNNGVWLADTQRKLGSVYLNLKQPEKALKLLAVAQKSFPADYFWDHAQISMQQARAYKMLNQHKKAFQAQKAFAQALKENASRNQNAEIAQSLTQINLELEEELSRSLMAAEQLQKIEAELNAANRIEQEKTLLLINGIWVASGLLLFSGVLGLLWIRQQNKRIIRLNRHLREDILQRFLPPVIAEKVAKGEAVLDETPHEQEMTALFGRLVGLEHAIEELGPRVTSRLLESLMQAVTDISLKHNGCLDKLHRGSFLILFGAPLHRPVEEQIQDAIGFAHSIQERFLQIRENWPVVEGWRPGLAIGIHHGSALVGVFGGKRRADYTAVGQTVNLAARIEGEAKAGEILVSENVASILAPGGCRAVGEVRLKGISKPQKLFIVEAQRLERSAS